MSLSVYIYHHSIPAPGSKVLPLSLCSLVLPPFSPLPLVGLKILNKMFRKGLPQEMNQNLKELWEEIFFNFLIWGHLGDAQGLLLALYTGTTPGNA